MKELKAFVPEAYPMQIGDVVCTAARVPVVWEVVKRHATSGWRNMFNRYISTHVGFIVNVYGKWMVAELTNPRGRIIPFEFYITRKWNKPRIVCVKRFPIYNSSKEVRVAANERIIRDCVNFEYDIPGLLEFYNICKDRPNDYYCSEFVHYETKIDGVKWPKKYDKKIGPYSIELEENSKMMWHE